MKRLTLWLGMGAILKWLWTAWTSPRTWATDELVTATIMNTHIRDNQNALKDPPSDNYELNEVSDISRGGAGWEDVDGTNFSFTLVTTGGDVMCHFHGTFYTTSASARLFLDVEVDGGGNRTAGDDGICTEVIDVNGQTLTFTRLITGLSAGSHTFDLQWSAQSIHRLAAGAATANFDVHPQFWAREVS